MQGPPASGLFQGIPDMILNEGTIPGRLQIVHFDKSQCPPNVINIYAQIWTKIKLFSIKIFGYKINQMTLKGISLYGGHSK